VALKEPEKILANVVLLLGENTTLNLNSSELQPVFRDPGLQMQAVQLPGQPAQVIQITSLREQMVMVMNAGAGQLIIEDKSAEWAPRGRVSEVVNGLVSLFNAKGVAKFRAYGFNFHVAFDVPGDRLSGQFLAEKFINVQRIQERGDIEVGGGGLRLYFNSGSAVCDFRLEPHENRPNAPRLFASINYNYELEEGNLPAGDVLRSDFLGKWNVFTQFLEALVQ
jgi:hypothetical protein